MLRSNMSGPTITITTIHFGGCHRRNVKPMTLQPNPNPDDQKREVPPAGGDHNVVHGSVGPGSVVGRGSVHAQNIAQGDIIIEGDHTDTHAQFAGLLDELEDLIKEAQKAGELDDKRAKEAIDNLETASEMIREEKEPPKSKIMEKLQYVTDVIDAAVDTFSDSQGPAKILLKALPVAALLIKLAARIF